MPEKTVIGTETEFGITIKKGEGYDPVTSSLFIINHLRPFSGIKVLWDYENEDPLVDARGFMVEGEKERPTYDENLSINKPLENGGRLYVDGAHPEYSTPECTNPRDIVIYEKAGEKLMQICLENANRIRKEEERYILYKNNTDSKGNSYGYHENYLMRRSTPFDRIVQSLVPFLVTRQIYAGAGKVGSEDKENPAQFQISQRADFFETLIDLNTMAKRPIINTRDEPHADPELFRRFHVIVGDSNMSEFSTYLKIGTTVLVLHMIDNGIFFEGLELEDPVKAIKMISRDLTLRQTVKLVSGKKVTPVDIQRIYLERCYEYYSQNPQVPYAMEVLNYWEDTLDKLEKDPMELSKKLDWVIKFQLIDNYRERKGLGWDDPKLNMIDLQYHDLNPERGIYYTMLKNGYIDSFITEGMVLIAKDTPPADTRAFFRGMCIKKYPKEIYAASWSSILFDIGNYTIKRVPLLHPLKGTKEIAGDIIAKSDTADELIKNLAT